MKPKREVFPKVELDLFLHLQGFCNILANCYFTEKMEIQA